MAEAVRDDPDGRVLLVDRSRADDHYPLFYPDLTAADRPLAAQVPGQPDRRRSLAAPGRGAQSLAADPGASTSCSAQRWASTHSASSPRPRCAASASSSTTPSPTWGASCRRKCWPRCVGWPPQRPRPSVPARPRPRDHPARLHGGRHHASARAGSPAAAGKPRSGVARVPRHRRQRRWMPRWWTN